MLREALKQSCDEKSFKLAVRSASEILALSIYLYMESDFRQPVLFDLFHFVVPDLETVRALGRHKFNSVRS